MLSHDYDEMTDQEIKDMFGIPDDVPVGEPIPDTDGIYLDWPDGRDWDRDRKVDEQELTFGEWQDRIMYLVGLVLKVEDNQTGEEDIMDAGTLVSPFNYHYDLGTSEYVFATAIVGDAMPDEKPEDILSNILSAELADTMTSGDTAGWMRLLSEAMSAAMAEPDEDFDPRWN